MPRMTERASSVFVVAHRLQFLSQESSVSQGSAFVASTLKYCRILWYWGNTQCKWVLFWFSVYRSMPEKTSLDSSWVVGESGVIILSCGGKACRGRAAASPEPRAGKAARLVGLSEAWSAAPVRPAESVMALRSFIRALHTFSFFLKQCGRTYTERIRTPVSVTVGPGDCVCRWPRPAHARGPRRAARGFVGRKDLEQFGGL